MTRAQPAPCANGWTKSAVPRGKEAIAAEWADKAQALLAAPKLNIADALAWQRDAAKAGAPLSREPLSLLKVQLADRVKVIEDLQHRVQVQREAAVLLAQRIEVLSTKPWRDAHAALELLRADVARWQEQAQELTGDASWASVEARFPLCWMPLAPSCWWCGRLFSLQSPRRLQRQKMSPRPCLPCRCGRTNCALPVAYPRRPPPLRLLQQRPASQPASPNPRWRQR